MMMGDTTLKFAAWCFDFLLKSPFPLSLPAWQQMLFDEEEKQSILMNPSEVSVDDDKCLKGNFIRFVFIFVQLDKFGVLLDEGMPQLHGDAFLVFEGRFVAHFIGLQTSLATLTIIILWSHSSLPPHFHFLPTTYTGVYEGN